MCISESVRWGVCASPISSLTSLCFSASVWWRLCALANKFGDEIVWCIESVHWRVSASAYQFPNEVARSSELVCWRVCASMNQFANEVVHPWISLVTSMCILEIVRWGVYTLPTSPLTSQGLSASVHWRVRASANQFADESELQRISSLNRLCGTSNQFAEESKESVRWRVYASAN